MRETGNRHYDGGYDDAERFLEVKERPFDRVLELRSKTWRAAQCAKADGLDDEATYLSGQVAAFDVYIAEQEEVS